MRKVKLILSLILSMCVLQVNPSYANEQDKPTSLAQLVEHVRQEAEQEKQHHLQREQRFVQERDKQKQRLQTLKTKIQEAKLQAEKLSLQHNANQQKLETLQERIDERSKELSRLFSIAKQNAMEITPLINQSMLNAQFPQRGEILNQITAKKEQTLSMQELKSLWLLLLDEMHENGKITQFNTTIISPNGETTEAQVTRTGVFTATSQGQFLRYLPETGKLVQLARQPANHYQELAEQFEQSTQGQKEMVLDPSKGNILTVLLQTPRLTERIEQGGVIAYLILFFGALGLFIVLFRYLGMSLTSLRIHRQLKQTQAQNNNPMGRLMQLLTQLSHAKPETISLHLDEAVGNEAAKLHFGLKTLAVFAAITPLLGLLGTVTGMIETFQSISLFGSGDPKMMSGGISQALITTQLGLAVAIPILLMHTLLQGKANRLVEILDAQSSLLFEHHLNQHQAYYPQQSTADDALTGNRDIDRIEQPLEEKAGEQIG